LHSGAEEYFNKKKMLNTKCCGVVRGQSARTTHPNCVENYSSYMREQYYEKTHPY